MKVAESKYACEVVHVLGYSWRNLTYDLFAGLYAVIVMQALVWVVLPQIAAS